jgi:hypothetical protein
MDEWEMHLTSGRSDRAEAAAAAIGKKREITFQES